ncbi:ImmA/IrrE family metallo-endopeptidase [Sphingosinicella sp.]|uniref:ImmA/IrrE family metallo-endopeptidase n=1 Tax=Sphingosinicella sp. TaxID=1917971 RepID=UPI004037ECB0
MPGFEGALGPLRKRGGWAILYNPAVHSPGRINYTLGHEFGHYLCHRQQSPGGFQCGESDVLGGTRDQEREADRFASYLLMPLDDFRAQVGSQKMDLALLRHCADRYDVSLTAAALKWLESASRCAAVVVATNGFVQWFRRNAAAERARIFFPPGMELPAGSVAAGGDATVGSIDHAPGVWWSRPTHEVAIFADHYEMTISLLVFEDFGMMPEGWEDEPTEDAFDRFTAASR